MKFSQFKKVSQLISLLIVELSVIKWFIFKGEHIVAPKVFRSSILRNFHAYHLRSPRNWVVSDFFVELHECLKLKFTYTFVYFTYVFKRLQSLKQKHISTSLNVQLLIKSQLWKSQRRNFREAKIYGGGKRNVWKAYSPFHFPSPVFSKTPTNCARLTLLESIFF